MLVGVHNQTIPGDEAVVSERDFLHTNKVSLSNSNEVTPYG